MSEQLDCPEIRLHLEKNFSTTSTFLQYFWAGKSSIFQEKPALANKEIQLDAYETLIIATPVWAGNISSPIRSFLAGYTIKDKRVYLVATNSGGSFSKAFASMRMLLPNSKVYNEIGFVKVTRETLPIHLERLEAFCKEILEGK